MLIYLKKASKVFIPHKIRKWLKKRVILPIEYTRLSTRYAVVLEKIRERVRKQGEIRVCFFVTYAATFAACSVLEKMLSDPCFDPFVVIVPDVSRGDDNMKFNMEKSYNAISQKYPTVKLYRSFDEKTKEYIDYSDQIDLLFPSSPDDSMMHYYYKISYLRTKELLTFYVNYGYSFLTKYGINIIKSIEYISFWRIAVESVSSKISLLKYYVGKDERMLVSGYCKMDSFAKVKVLPRSRKRIVIAPHHTVRKWKGSLNLSQFLRYSDFFIELPKLYPEIDFVLRPHPLLIFTLNKKEVWGVEKTEKYLDALKTIPNILYDDTSEYFELLKNSDALIHDCCSFLAEYFYTGAPQCYMLRDEAAINEEFLPFGKEMLNHVYKAFSEDQILHFIDHVVLKGKDTMKIKREMFAKESVMINYPNASEFIVEYIKEKLKPDFQKEI